jgi:sugar lactone lactonase YvrE
VPEGATNALAGGFLLPECPRWHDGALWLVDMQRRSVHRIAGDVPETVASFDHPSAVGFRPDGSMVVVDGTTRLVHVVRDGVVVETLDLSRLTPHLNDMVVDQHGWAYIDGFGIGGSGSVGGWTADGCIVLVAFDSPPRVVAEGLVAPNGIGISPDGRTLVVGEAVNAGGTRGARLVGFAIAADGSLSERRIMGTIPRGLGDGLCFDSEGGIWVGTAWGHEAQRFLDGEVVERVPLGDRRWALACALGGPDLRTLFICSTAASPGGNPSDFTDGRVETTEVRVPGFAPW